MRTVTPCCWLARTTSCLSSLSRATCRTLAPGLARSWFIKSGSSCCHVSSNDFLSLHQRRYSVDLKVMGRSMVGFLGSMTTICICNCVGSWAVLSISWISWSKGPRACGGAVRRSCAETASGPLARSGSFLMAWASCPMVMALRPLACWMDCSCRLVLCTGWLS